MLDTLIKNQTIRFDNHKSGAVVKNLDFLHMHKTMNKGGKYSKAEILIYVNGETKWNCKDIALKKELHEVFDKMKTEEKIAFVFNVKTEVERYCGGDISIAVKDNIAKNLIMAFYGDLENSNSEKNRNINNIIRSKPFRRIFFSDCAEFICKIDGRKYRVCFTKNGKGKIISIKDITNL